MEQNMQPNNHNTHPVIWVLIGVLSAVIIFTSGYIIANNLGPSQPTEVNELTNPTTVDEQAEAVATPVAEEAVAPTEPAQPDVNVEIVIDADALANATVKEAPVLSDTIIYQADVYEYLTLRSSPSTSATALSLLPPYTRMQIIEHSNATMAKVYLIDSRQEGYINKEYISPEGSVMKRAGKAPSVSISDHTIYYADVHESLTLRDAASTNAREIAFLPPFSAVQIIERSGKMAYVYVLDSGMTGWVNTDYVVSNINHCIRAGKSAPTSHLPRDYEADVNEFLTLRNAPSTSGGEIKKLPRGTRMSVIEWTNAEFAYVQVYDEAGSTGYVMSKHLKIAS